MRILQAMAGAPEGGAETFFARLAVALHESGVRQRFVVRRNEGRESVLLTRGIDVATAPFGGPLDRSTRRILRGAIDSFHPDIVLTWMNRATAHCPQAGPDRPFIHVGTPRGYYHPKYYRDCDHLVVSTEDLMQFYRRSGWPAERISVIPNFAPDERAAPVSRAALDTPDDAPLMLALGRLHPNKGFDVLLDGMQSLPHHYLWIGGEGPLENSLKKRAQDIGVSSRVRFLGWRKDTPSLFAAADLFICSSRHEPFGNIVIEAWLHGVPLIAAASEGPATLVADGINGLLVPLDDAQALAAAVTRLEQDPALAARLAAAGRDAYEERYTAAAVVPRYCALFERLAG
jgi:glycosyltransferase involved in cell wall biosynthesis